MTTNTRLDITCDVPVFYATSEGQTRRIAERLATVLCDHGMDSVAVDVRSVGAIDWSRVRAAVIGASIHVGRHQAAAAAFVKAHAAQLNAVPSAFFSVSLSAASRNADEVSAAKRIAEAFPSACGWSPATIASFAGRLAYTQYGFVKRILMKYIARKEGAPTDTSRDVELTDWHEVDELAAAIARLVRQRSAGHEPHVA